GARGQSFAGVRPVAQPLIERRVHAICEPGDLMPCGERLWRAQLGRRRPHPSHGALRLNRARTFADGLGGESSRARKRACALSSRKNVRWSRIASSAWRRALSSMNSDSFCPRSAAARLRIAFVSAEARIWITSSLRRALAGIAGISVRNKLVYALYRH